MAQRGLKAWSGAEARRPVQGPSAPSTLRGRQRGASGPELSARVGRRRKGASRRASREMDTGGRRLSLRRAAREPDQHAGPFKLAWEVASRPPARPQLPASPAGAQRGRHAHLPDRQGPRPAGLRSGQVQLRGRRGAIRADHGPAAPRPRGAGAPAAAARAAAAPRAARRGPALPSPAAVRLLTTGPFVPVPPLLHPPPLPVPEPWPRPCLSSGSWSCFSLGPGPVPMRA